MITPAKDFRQSENGKRWNDMIDSALFHDGMKAALLEHAMRTTNIDQLKGAHDFLRILMHLCDTPPKPSSLVMTPNLTQPS